MTDIVNLSPHYIGSPTPGVNLYQLPNAAMQVLGDIINATWTEGKLTKAEFSAKISTAMSGFLDITSAPHVTTGSVAVPVISEPAVDIPASVTVDDIYDQWAVEYANLGAWLDGKFSAFRGAYFPDDTALLGAVLGRLASLAGTPIDTITGTAVTASSVSGSVSGGTISAEGITANAVTATVTPEVISADSISALGGMLDPFSTDITAGSVSAPYTAEPPVLVSNDVDLTNALTIFDNTYADLLALIENKFASFRSANFTNDDALWYNASDWLNQAISDYNVATPPSFISQIFADDQARILSDKARAQDSVVSQFASRRFPLPPGAAASAVLQIEQKAQDDIAAGSRKVAQLSVEMMPRLMEQAMKIRFEVLQSANEYLKTLTSSQDVAIKIMSVGYDAQSRLVSSVSSLLNARKEVSGLTLDASKFSANLAFEAAKANQLAELEAQRLDISLIVEGGKLGLEASRMQAQLALEAAKANQATALDADKFNVQTAVENSRLGLDANKTHAQLSVEAGRGNQTAAIEAGKANLGAAIESAKLSYAASEATARIMLDAAKANQMAQLEQCKTALTTTVQYRNGSMQSCVDYIRAMASAPEAAARLSNVGYDAQSKLISSAAQFYNARTQAKEAIAKVSQYNNSVSLQADEKNQMSDLTLIEDKLKAMLAEAQSIAQMATALFNNIHVGATLQANGGTTVSQSNEF